MTRQLLIATSVALALSVTACGRNDDRADANRVAPGANTAVTTPPALPQDNPSSSATGGTSGIGAAGTAGSPTPESAAPGSDATSGMGTGSTSPGAAPQPYGTQSSSPPTGTPSSDAGSTAR